MFYAICQKYSTKATDIKGICSQHNKYVHYDPEYSDLEYFKHTPESLNHKIRKSLVAQLGTDIHEELPVVSFCTKYQRANYHICQ